MDNAAIVCDEIIVIWEAKGKRHDKETKKNLIKQEQRVKHKISIFCLPFS